MIKYKSVYDLCFMYYNLDQDLLIERIFACLLEDGNKLQYGEYINKVRSNGMKKVLKSLKLYFVKGRAENKKIFIHPKIQFIIDTTISEPKIVAKNLINLVNGDIGLPSLIINDLSDYNKLPLDKYSIESLSNYGTYIIYNPENQLFKIGRSKNLFNRLTNLKRDVSKDLKLIAYLDCDYEGQLHKHFNKKRKFGEWFELSCKDLEYIQLEYKFIFYDNYLLKHKNN